MATRVEPPRALTTDAGWWCVADDTSDAVLCLDEISVSGTGAYRGQLKAGRLGDGTAALPGIGSILLHLSGDRELNWPGRYQATLVPGGRHVVWSAPQDDRPDAPVALSIAELRDGQPVIRNVGTDRTNWHVSGGHLFWLRGAGATTPKRLEVARFPEADQVVPLVDGALRYFVVRPPMSPPTSVAVLLSRAGRQDLYMLDGLTPMPTPRLVDGAVQRFRRSTDASWLAYSKLLSRVDEDWGDLFLLRTQPGARPCTVTTRTDAEVIGSTGTGRLVAINQDVGNATGRIILNLNDPSNCRSRGGIADWSVYWPLDSRSDRFAISMAVSWAAPFGMGLLATGDDGANGLSVAIQAPTLANFGLLQATPSRAAMVMYSVAGGWQHDGLYLWEP